VLSLIPAILRFAAFSLKIQTSASEDSTLLWVLHSDQPTVLAVFANTPFYGGGMRVAPRASMEDGLLDICLISDITKLKLLAVFPSVYFARHLGMKEVEYFQSSRLRVETERPMDVYADGEYVCATPVEVGVHGKALKVLTP